MRKLLIPMALLVGVASFLAACSTTKFVPDDELLLDKVKVRTEGRYRDVNTQLFRNYVHQNPNSRWFSVLRLPLGVYSLSGRDSSRWINRTLRNIGEAPVIYDSLQTRLTCIDLCQELRNEGYLNAQVVAQEHRKGKKVRVNYQLQPGEAYYLRDIIYDIYDEQIDSILKANNDSAHRLLYPGMKFDVNKLDEERKRLTSFLTEHGYFRFHKEYITYLADTAAGSRQIELTLRLLPYGRHDQPDTLHTRYTMRNVTFTSGNPEDAKIHLRNSVLHECTHLQPGHYYSAKGLQQTYNHFSRLQAVKYTNISFQQVPSTNLLDCDIQLQTNKPSTISFQPEGTNTAGDLGAAASLTYQNRNLFRGSEVFSVELRGAYEAIRGLEGYSNQNFMEYSVETRLSFPRFIAPFLSSNFHRSVNARSEVALLYDMQDRPEFHRRVLSASWRYKWQFPTSHSQYQIDLLDLNYVFMPWISSTFSSEYLESENSRNAILRYNYEDLFIMKIGFGFSYSHRNVAIKTNVETSGNLLALGAQLFHGDRNQEGQYSLFNIAFAQYAKADLDVTRSFQIDRNNQVVLHMGLGVAYPYGNSTILPFEKRYFSGGANSVRGWSVRSLGPGSFMEQDGRINFINQTGDMKLDLNAEYRTHLFWKLNGALFVDAGNIWTIRAYDDQPGGQFRFNTFINQLAVGYGLGFRFNFDFFILRFDLGMKAINPGYEIEEDEHFPLLHPKLSRDFAFHFAVGLPF